MASDKDAIAVGENRRGPPELGDRRRDLGHLLVTMRARIPDLGRGVTVFNSSGEKIDCIAVSKPWTANITVGGKDLDTLFITASDSLHSIQTRIHGVR